MKRPRKSKAARQPTCDDTGIHAFFEGLKGQIKEKLRWQPGADTLGEAGQYAPGSREHDLAVARDEADQCFAMFAMSIASLLRVRAETSRSAELVNIAALAARGDGHTAIELMRRYHEVCDEETKPGEDPLPGTFPDAFAWDTYLRVSALADLAEEFPDHLRHSARFMHGWPMIVSHHFDRRAEFKRIAARLELGAEYPLNAGPRKRRGAETLLLRHLEPLIWRLHVLRGALIESEETRKGEDFVRRIHYFWWQLPDPEPTPEMQAILRRLPTLPPLNRKTAREWSREAIVPILMLEDASDAESCEVPVLQNIWRHKSVKSRATFQSRLHSAVTDVLQRFGRPG